MYTAADRERFVSEDSAHKRSDRDDFARDQARIVHSASLRRLSTKTQVWQSGTNDFVRNRLTHSLEVAQIGRELAAALGCNQDVVDGACLAHDLGHPPFGHHGETVLNEIADDFGAFEGNAQTFRLLTRLEAKREDAHGRSVGLNLTRATLDASIKYPWGRGERPTPKFGFYADDAEIFDFVRHDAGEGKCLEAQLMDWADDIAYSVHDVEDGIASEALEVRDLSKNESRERVIEIARNRYGSTASDDVLAHAYTTIVTEDLPQAFEPSRSDLAKLKDMTSTLIGRFAAAAEDATRERYGRAPLVRYEADLVIPEDVAAQVDILKSISAAFIMFTPKREAQLISQRATIEWLVAYYRGDAARLDPIFAFDWAASSDEVERQRIIIDQVASLTDTRAMAMFAAREDLGPDVGAAP